MTAANAFARDDGAWLMADTACYDHRGRVQAFSRKMSFSGDLRLAITHAGSAGSHIWLDQEVWLEQHRTQNDALDDLPRFLQAQVDIVAHGNESQLPPGIKFVVAWWDGRQACGRTGIIASSDTVVPGIPKTFALVPARTIFSPSLRNDPWPGHTFKPRADGARLAELQRHEADERGLYLVGGLFEACRVHDDGIERYDVALWPEDEVGEPVAVTAAREGRVRHFLRRRGR